MDPPFGSSNTTPPAQRFHHGHPHRTWSAQTIHGHPEPSVTWRGETLRREHSDSDMLDNMVSSRSRISSDTAAATIDRESWMRSIRDPLSARQDAVSRAQLATTRAAVIAANRRRSNLACDRQAACLSCHHQIGRDTTPCWICVIDHLLKRLLCPVRTLSLHKEV